MWYIVADHTYIIFKSLCTRLAAACARWGGGGHVCVPLRRKEVHPRQRMKTLHMMVNGITYHIRHNIPHLQYSPPQLNPRLNSLHRACMRDGNVWLPPLRLATKMTVVAFFVTTQVSWSLPKNSAKFKSPQRVSIAISCYKIFKYNAYMQYM